jgi:hypothetical protein
MKGKLKLQILVGAAAISAVALAAQAGKALYINGTKASSDVRTINGKVYVPLNDVAKALGMTVQPKSGGYEMIKAGGAGQIANKNVGNLGEEIFTGKWRFTALSVEHVQNYTPQYAPKDAWRILEAKDGEELIVVKCRVKNGTAKKDELVFANWEDSNTALTDMDEQSYQPTTYGFDLKADESSPDGANLLPGAAVNFNLIFRVPAGTREKDLVFTAIRYDMRGKLDQKKDPPQDIRVHLNVK